MKHLFYLVLAVVLIGGLAVEALAKDINCSATWGGCTIQGDYYSGINTTIWAWACDDGSSGWGAMSGNHVPGICFGG